jgi:hypothetical protein
MADPIDGAGYGDIGFFDGGYGDHTLGYGSPLIILAAYSIGGNVFHDIGGEVCTIHAAAGTFDQDGFEVEVNGVKAYSGVRGQGFWVYPNVEGSEFSFVVPDLYEQLGMADIEIDGPGGPQSFPSILKIVRYSHRTNNELVKSRWPTPPYYVPRAVARGGDRWTPGVIEKCCEAVGEADALLGGTLFTYLTDTLDPGDTVLRVESTHKWGTVGEVRVGQETMRYEAISDTTISVVERHPLAQPFPRGTRVVDVSRTYSMADQVRRQLFYPTAEGEYLDVLIRNHGLPVPLLQEDQKRAFGIYASYPAAGPLRTISELLTDVRPGQMRYGDVEPVTLNTIRLDGTGGGFPGGQTGYQNRLIRILEPSKNAGLYRIQSVFVDGVTAKIHAASGPYWSGADHPVPGLVPESNVAFELVVWDVWEDPTEQARFHVDLLELSAFISVKGATYLQGGEPATSTTTTSVTVIHDINQVLGVFLRGDVERQGTNYFTGGSFLGKVITLGTALPAPNTEVFVDYGAATTAQLLAGPSVDGETYYPFYLSGPSAIYESILYVVRAGGYLPVVTTVVI